MKKGDKKMIYEPLFDRILAKSLDMEEKTSSGIVLGKTSEQGAVKACVVSTGHGTFENGVFVPMCVQKGDVVLFEEQYAVEIYIKGQKYYLVKQTDILAKEKGENEGEKVY